MADILEEFDDGEAVERSADICLDLAWDRVVKLIDELEGKIDGVLPGHLAMISLTTLVAIMVMRGMSVDEVVNMVKFTAEDARDNMD